MFITYYLWKIPFIFSVQQKIDLKFLKMVVRGPYCPTVSDETISSKEAFTFKLVQSARWRATLSNIGQVKGDV